MSAPPLPAMPPPQHLVAMVKVAASVGASVGATTARSVAPDGSSPAAKKPKVAVANALMTAMFSKASRTRPGKTPAKGAVQSNPSKPPLLAAAATAAAKENAGDPALGTKRRSPKRPAAPTDLSAKQDQPSPSKRRMPRGPDTPPQELNATKKKKMSLKLMKKSNAHASNVGPADPHKSVNDRLMGLSAANGTPAGPVVPAPPLVGLANLGNTCYVNSVLQALRRCKSFADPIMRFTQGKTPDDSASTTGSLSVLTHLSKLFHEMGALESNPPADGAKDGLMVKPTALHSAIGAANEMFNNNKQHDAQEFLHFMVASIQEAMLQDGVAASSAVNAPNVPKLELEGLLQYQTRCCECETITKRQESFVDLTLPVSKEGKKSLLWSIRQLCSVPERMKGRNKYSCETCNRFTEADRRQFLDKIPETLILHLNRSSRGATKVGAHVQAPMQLRLDSWSASDGAPAAAEYELAAMVFHSGYSASSGHYTCYAKSPINLPGNKTRKQWTLYDDDSVRVVPQRLVETLLEPASMSTPTAFILFYIKT